MVMTEILQITIPALLVLVMAYIILDKMLKNDQNRRNYELRKSSLTATIPLRLRAYERLMLVIERTTPNKIIINIIQPEMTCFGLQAQLLSNIREEFSHNVSQQIYVSSELWTVIRATEESLIKLINMCASQFAPEMPAAALAERIIEIYTQSEKSPGEIATEMLKKEVREMM